jgi:hypothetical protein
LHTYLYFGVLFVSLATVGCDAAGTEESLDSQPNLSDELKTEEAAQAAPDKPLPLAYDCEVPSGWQVPQTDQVEFWGAPYDVLNGEDLNEFELSVCPEGEASCVVAPMDPNGGFSTALPMGDNGFDGYVRVVADDYISSIIYVVPSVTRDLWYDPQMVSELSFDLFATLGQAVPDPSRGHIAVAVSDCDWNYGEGVVIEVSTADDATIIAYSDGLLPNPDRTSTDDGGLAGAFNIVPGPITVTALVEGVAVMSVDAHVEAGKVTQVPLAPFRL